MLVSLLAKANATPGEGAEPTSKTDLLGGVYSSETKKPLGSVVVTAYHVASKKGKVVLTDSRGNYSFNDLQAGTYRFVFSKDGYKKVSCEKVNFRPDEGFHMNVELIEQKVFDFFPGIFHFSDF